MDIEFGTDNQTPDRLHYHCKECRHKYKNKNNNANSRKYYVKNAEHIKKARNQRYVKSKLSEF